MKNRDLMTEKRGKNVKKAIELCCIVCLGICWIMSTAKISVTFNDILFLMQFICEILRIVLSIGGFIVVYGNIYVKMNNKTNYIAVSSLEHCILFIVGIKCYIFPELVELHGEYGLYTFVLECFQISMLVIVMKYIDEKTDLKKWLVTQLVLISAVAFFVLDSFNIVGRLFGSIRVQIISRLVLLIISIALIINYKKSENTLVGENKRALEDLLKLKIIISIFEIIKMSSGLYWISLVQYMLQIIFILGIMVYIDKFTLESIWEKVEDGVKDRKYQVALGKDEQRILVNAAKEIKHYIEEIVNKVDQLEIGLKGQEKRHLEKVKNNSYRLLNLSNHILIANEYEHNLAKEMFKGIDLGIYVKEIIGSIEPYIEQKGIHLEYIVPEDPIIIEVNKEAIERILLNLISNAIKYNKKNGWIQVTLSERRNHVYLCVRDSGIGISSEDLENIFGKFKRVESKESKQQEGSGLGLSIVKSLVELHKGQIKAVSSEGKGTIISIELPLNQKNT